jgi:hypothetical protein
VDQQGVEAAEGFVWELGEAKRPRRALHSRGPEVFLVGWDRSFFHVGLYKFYPLKLRVTLLASHFTCCAFIETRVFLILVEIEQPQHVYLVIFSSFEAPHFKIEAFVQTGVVVVFVFRPYPTVCNVDETICAPVLDELLFSEFTAPLLQLILLFVWLSIGGRAN